MPDLRPALPVRFIPACAGNRLIPLSIGFRYPVHPRVCGEQSKEIAPITNVGGSSPRVRGTAAPRRSSGSGRRFIPACAGNSVGELMHTCGLTVHPRVCGEQRCAVPIGPRRCGSSPRVRGTVAPASVAREMQRFIPACAGNRCRWPSFPDRRSVHPRVCGEQICRADPCRCGLGSSPRVRGTDPEAGLSGQL